VLTPKRTNAKRNVLFLALMAGTGALTGCASTGNGMFANNEASPPAAASPAGSGGIGQTFSNISQGARSQVSSMGMAMRSAVDKGRNSISGLFGGTTEVTAAETGETLAANDPTSLQNEVKSVDAEVFVANGQLWESTGKFEQAMENYGKALEREPNNGAALASVARLHFKQQKYDQSVQYFQRAIQAEPKEAGLYNDLGLALSKLGKHDEAVAMIQRAIEVAPNGAASSRYGNNMATVLFEAGQPDAAKEVLKKHNAPVVAHYNMAYLHYAANQKSAALQELGQALSLSGSAGEDPASKQAVSKSKELFAQLGGSATQAAQQLPEMYGAAQESAQAVAKLGKEASAIASQFRQGNQVAAPPASEVPPSLQQEPRTSAAANATAAAPAATAKPNGADAATPARNGSGGLFSLPPGPQAEVAEQPSTTQR
jgi:Tfp pilus assembly protein PilF